MSDLSQCMDKCSYYLKKYEKVLGEKGSDITDLENKNSILNDELIKEMSIYDKTMLELENKLETDFDNTIQKMMQTTAAFRVKFDEMSKKITRSDEQLFVENDAYWEIIQGIKHVLFKCVECTEA